MNIPEGNHTARCTHVLNIGTHDKFPTVLIGWELPEVMEDGNPVLMFKEFCFSYSRFSTLRPFLENWRGKQFTITELQEFDLQRVLDTKCTLFISDQYIGDGKYEPAIAAIAKLPDVAVCNPRVHDLVHYEFEQGRNVEFDLLPKWIQEKIENCHEWKNPPIKQEVPEDVIP